MPLYEYECPSCKRRFELRRGIHDAETDLKCPKCGGLRPRRVFSTFATASSASSCAPGGFT